MLLFGAALQVLKLIIICCLLTSYACALKEVRVDAQVESGPNRQSSSPAFTLSGIELRNQVGRESYVIAPLGYPKSPGDGPICATT